MQPEGYEIINEITNLRDVLALLNEGGWWLFCGGEPWHGDSKTLDDIDRILDNKDETWLPGGAYISVFLVNPHKISVKWGQVKVKGKADADTLRQYVTVSMADAITSQKFNLVR